MRLSIRQRLLAVVAFAAIACGGALFAILLLARTGIEQRVERARDAATREVDRVRDAYEDGRLDRLAATHSRRWQSGVLDPRLDPVGGTRVPGPVARSLLEIALPIASRAPDEVTLREARTSEGVLVVGVAPLGDSGPFAWSAMRVPVPRDERLWRLGLYVLAISSLLLVFASIHTVVVLDRGTAQLKGALGDLGRDLGATVARPSVRELGEVADGIEALARGFASAKLEQERLTHALAERERLASLGRVAAGLAHEVRNPLASIKLRVDLAQRDPGTPEALARDLGDISSEVARLDRLVTDLLAVAGRRTGPRETCDLEDLAQRRVELLRAWAEETGRVQFTVRGHATATVDTDALSRALDNLLRNAVQAAPPESVVQVEVRDDRSHGQCAIAVIDQGPGVPAGREHELFEPFFTTRAEGTGLGLALSRSVAVAHGGSLGYTRGDDATRFELVLPRASEAS